MSFTDRVGTDNPLLYWHFAQVSILDIVPHVRDTRKGVRSLLVRKLLVPDTNDILGLFADDGKWIRRLEGLGSRRFVFEQTFRGLNRLRLASASLNFLS